MTLGEISLIYAHTIVHKIRFYRSYVFGDNTYILHKAVVFCLSHNQTDRDASDSWVQNHD